MSVMITKNIQKQQCEKMKEGVKQTRGKKEQQGACTQQKVELLSQDNKDTFRKLIKSKHTGQPESMNKKKSTDVHLNKRSFDEN